MLRRVRRAGRGEVLEDTRELRYELPAALRQRLCQSTRGVQGQARYVRRLLARQGDVRMQRERHDHGDPDGRLRGCGASMRGVLSERRVLVLGPSLTRAMAEAVRRSSDRREAMAAIDKIERGHLAMPAIGRVGAEWIGARRATGIGGLAGAWPTRARA